MFCLRIDASHFARSMVLVLLGTALTFSAAAQSSATASDDVAAIIASPMRTDGDRAADATRKPAQFLSFAKVAPGMRALDISTGGGYTAELLVLSVGANGKVWGQVEKIGKTLQQRLDTQPQSNLVISVRPDQDPIPPEATQLDVITVVLAYHDIAYMPIDRIALDRQLFAALKPGGLLIIIDHAARAGSGISDSKTLHRIDEATVKADFASVGFKLDAESDFLRNPDDPRDHAFFDTKIVTDKFALRFVKPM